MPERRHVPSLPGGVHCVPCLPGGVERVVALGASNLARGLPIVVSAARASWGPRVEILAAPGHGRSYGVRSRVLFRDLPGILESGIWRALESRPRATTRALITDVGNDILYGFSPGQTLAWVEESIRRIRRVTDDVVLTDLPLAGVHRLSASKYLLLRSILFPSCRLSLAQVLERGEAVSRGLAELASAHGATFAHLDPAWYGFDPIHVRPAAWKAAWRHIVGVPDGIGADGGSIRESLRLYLLRPERRWLFGREQFTPQPGVALPAGGRVWLY